MSKGIELKDDELKNFSGGADYFLVKDPAGMHGTLYNSEGKYVASIDNCWNYSDMQKALFALGSGCNVYKMSVDYSQTGRNFKKYAQEAKNSSPIYTSPDIDVGTNNFFNKWQ